MKSAGKKRGSGNLRGHGRLNCAFESEYYDIISHYIRSRATVKRSKTDIEDFKKLIESTK